MKRNAAQANREFEVFSGHESFVCRYGWLPKLYEALCADPELFADDDRAIVTLGIGKNMVKSIRFWGHAFGLTETAKGKRGGKVLATEFARLLLDPKQGRDPYLEDAASLWRLHWMLTTRSGMGAWAVAFTDIHEAEISKPAFTDSIKRRAMTARGAVTAGTIDQHVEIFLRTYDSGRMAPDAVLEDSLGCPLQELALLDVRDVGSQAVVRFRRGPKSGLDEQSLAFAVADYWKSTDATSRTISLRSLMLGRESPGAVFRLDEASMHVLLDRLCSRLKGFSLRDDGAGGVDFISGDTAASLASLERFAWH